MDRFKAASNAGFRAVEYLFPYDYSIQALQKIHAENHLALTLFNLPPGDTARGEWGLLSDPTQKEIFRSHLVRALDYASALGCTLVNGMFGQRVAGFTENDQDECALDNLRWAAPLARERGVTLLLEPLNPVDFPRYGLSTTAHAVSLLEALHLEEVKLQLDLYHCVSSGEDPFKVIEDSIRFIGHLQLADVPGRHAPGSGKIPFREIFTFLESLEYKGACGLEYKPEGNSPDSFDWMREYDWR